MEPPYDGGTKVYSNGPGHIQDGGSAVAVVECRTPEREVRGSNLPPPCCVLEQDTLLPESLVKPRKRWLRPDLKNC